MTTPVSSHKRLVCRNPNGRTSRTFYKVLRRVSPRLYLHADGQRNQHRPPGCKELYAYGDVVAKLIDREAKKPIHRR
ncbi:hypothetical protein [Mycobacteroides abscessus]|uniref:hypothetical protein n=1 Tax=Mycobacteroides abscessus TaxID=36809 RepID=UPI00092A06BB|nr:hypothetical protein [Mycobacteroides abscessus]SHU71981.1 Uncharacterised protein [Mycobacteroides abscessus subsp. bolletii]SHW56175.1 Uncharacterised protein [Mycobacteroides abscessus subsp. bolletii]SHW83722.1 Uncharacterised protein [Mycobacteroides abscessus subsp. bolletii]SHW91949.1 Uncharacterised protein [Mycobacteroides abscessus subsp. bolletii]SKS00364.1 Uncharacterised protein [Mycobacteroides abscessus subsp. bolletii]